MIWHAIAGAIVFGLGGYLATRLAALVYGHEAPLADGPTPSTVPTALLIAVAAGIGAVTAGREADAATIAVVLVISLALCAVIWTDVTRGFIGDWFTIPPLVLVLVLGTLRGDILPIGVSVALATLPFAFAAFVSKGMGMGWGDVKLVALGSALLDARTSILMFGAACVVACAVALLRRRRSEPIAFAPYLAGAIAVGMILPSATNLG